MAGPLEIYVPLNPNAIGSGGDPYINMVMSAMRQTVPSTGADKNGNNPLNMFQLSMPQLGININALWIIAALLMLALLFTTTAKKGK